ncbi:MAG: hypothetical protein CL479_04465 [Acidobacteria bacterium]|nr:hypothetical protein [Acidobacteriota bacterium]|tara:strand:+ start:105 stop:713 length:609 start_codon:yes stop_codon:yes gene_type:complete
MYYRNLLSFTIGAIILGLFGTSSGIAESNQSDRVRVFVLVSEERPEDAIVDPDLPPGQWQLEPMSFGTEGNSYFFDLDQAKYLGEQLSRQLQRTDDRKELMELVETRDQAAVYLEIVATKVEGSIQGGGVFQGDGANAAPATNTTSVVSDALIVRLTMRFQPNHFDFLGTKIDALRTPERQVAQDIERFIEVNADALRTLNP